MTIPSKTKAPRKKTAPRPLSSENLFKEYRELVTTKQYRRSDDDLMEMIPMEKACSVEECNQHRLALAAIVLSAALAAEANEKYAEFHAEKSAVPIRPLPAPGGYQ
jgi:hypothetical protein